MAARTRADYIELHPSLSDAIEFENQCLSIGHEYLPECARAVLDEEAEPAPEYWQWLADQMAESNR